MMRSKATLLVLCVWGALLVGLVGIAQQSPTEAPAGFDTPALSQNPGSASISNGIAEPPGDTFALDQQLFEQIHDVNTGLGPVFNAASCVAWAFSFFCARRPPLGRAPTISTSPGSFSGAR